MQRREFLGTIVAGGAALGYAMDKWIFLPLRERGVSLISQMVVTIGLSLIFRLEIASQHFARRLVVAKIKGAIFAHQAIHRPHPGNVITPPGRSAGDRNAANTLISQTFHSNKNNGGQTAVYGKGVVNVCQDISNSPT